MEHVVVRVEAGEAGMRLDQLLAARLPDLSRSRLRQLIDAGAVLVGGAAAKASLRPRAGVQIEVSVPDPRPTALVPEDLRLPVLYQDGDLVVIDKPAGVAVHPGAGIDSGTVVHGLLHQVPGLAGIGGELRPGIVHRLDKETSGCLVVAKTEIALRGLQAQFKSRDVEKLYLAIVHGEPKEAGEFDTLHGRHPVDRKRFSSRVREGRRAVTRFRVLGRGGAPRWPRWSCSPGGPTRSAPTSPTPGSRCSATRSTVGASARRGSAPTRRRAARHRRSAGRRSTLRCWGSRTR